MATPIKQKTQRQKRGSNWTAKETISLVDLCVEQERLINGKFDKTEDITTQSKGDFWEETSVKINSIGTCHRDAEKVMVKWRDLKSKTKLKEQRRVADMKKTGGGDVLPPLADWEQKVVSIIPPSAIHGIDDGIDTLPVGNKDALTVKTTGHVVDVEEGEEGDNITETIVNSNTVLVHPHNVHVEVDIDDIDNIQEKPSKQRKRRMADEVASAQLDFFKAQTRLANEQMRCSVEKRALMRVRRQYYEAAISKLKEGSLIQPSSIFEEDFTTGYTFCPVNKSRHPFAVSIVDGDDACRHPNNAFPVQQAPPTGHARPKYNFTVCIAPIFGDYPPTHRLIEWIEMNRLFGVELFTFYNASISERLARILKQYEHRGIVEILQYKVPTSDIHYGAQVASMHDCLHRNQHRAVFTSFQDLDEFITPRFDEDLTWADMLKRLPISCSYSFRSSYFIGVHKEGSNNKDISLEKIVNQSIVLKHLRRNKKIFAHEKRSKVIVRPDEINTFAVHVTSSCMPGKMIGHVGPEIGMVHHYRQGINIDPNNTVVNKTALKYNNTLRQSLSKVQELISQAYS